MYLVGWHTEYYLILDLQNESLMEGLTFGYKDGQASENRT